MALMEALMEGLLEALMEALGWVAFSAERIDDVWIFSRLAYKSKYIELKLSSMDAEAVLLDALTYVVRNIGGHM